MKAPVQKTQRCAIYTRKSTDYNLDLAFNSLDAQREACEAYIKSQAHEGWVLVPDRFDDGAFSGASLVRPAVQELVEAIKARLIDVVVVYKVDRLTRSLADFAKLVELFDAHEVSFVSITQSFNTTSSMGRLTLNVLLSFAQFEREVISERVRDKIAASKRKGIWTGGMVPLGYRIVDKKLVVVPEEAEFVQSIFERFVRIGSIPRVIDELNEEGIAPVDRRRTTGRKIYRSIWTRSALDVVLKNRTYLGETRHYREFHPGEHEGIVDRALFDAAQARILARAGVRRASSPTAAWILKGLLFDDAGFIMSPSHASKEGRLRYRYYYSRGLLQGRRPQAGSITRVSAPEVEQLVIDALQKAGRADGSKDNAAVIQAHVARVIVEPKRLIISLHPLNDTDDASELVIPFAPWRWPRKGVTHAPEDRKPVLDAYARDALLRAIARAREWHEAVVDGDASFDEIATTEGLAPRYVRRLTNLAFLSPAIIGAIIDGSAPPTLTATHLTEALPLSWAEQERVFLPN